MNSKIAIVGAGASGKDHLRKQMEGRGMISGISCTTRPMRDNETNGVDYYFLTDLEFENGIKNDLFVEWQSFKDWKYGISKVEFIRSDVMILNAESVETLEPSYRDKLFVIYINISEETRRKRLVNRSDTNDMVERRIEADNKQFGNFLDFDCIITNENF